MAITNKSNIDGSVLAAFMARTESAIYEDMQKTHFDDEQHAPFTMPTWQEVERMRLGIEQVKARNVQTSPRPQLVTTHEGNNEL